MSRKFNLVPPIESVVESFISNTISVATPYVVNAETVMIEVQAQAGDVHITNSGTAGLTSGTFKYKVPENSTRHYPISSGAATTYSIIGTTPSTEVTIIEFRAM